METRSTRGPSIRAPWITIALCAIATLAFGIAASGIALPGVTGEGPVEFMNALHVVGLGGRSTPLIADAGEAWRLITCHFVHTSWLHLAFNIAFLFSVGGALEHASRRGDYAAVLVFVGAASALSSLLATPQVSAGASGLVFGVLGASVSFGFRHGNRLGRRTRRYFGAWVLPFLLVLLAVGVGNPGVDHASHLGGLVAGLLVGVWLPLRHPDPIYVPGTARTSPALVVSLVFAGIVMLGSPMLVGSGRTKVISLDDEVAVAVPRRWRARYGPLGEHEFTTAGGMVVLSVDRVPPRHREDPDHWYETHRLGPLQPGGRADGLERVASSEVRSLSAAGHRVRYRLRRDDTSMTRDVHFVRGTSSDELFVLALETPTAWVSKYSETRRGIVGSMTTGSPRAARTATAAP